VCAAVHLYPPLCSAAYQFTGQPYGQVVEPGTEASLEYKFFPSPQLDPIELQMALTVFYEDAITHKSYASTFYNGTVDFVDNTSPLDVRSGLKLTLVGGVFAAIVYFMVANGATKKKKGSRTAEVATAKEGEYADAFLQRTVRAEPCLGSMVKVSSCFAVPRGSSSPTPPWLCAHTVVCVVLCGPRCPAAFGCRCNCQAARTGKAAAKKD
jgi:hypothetical protein